MPAPRYVVNVEAAVHRGDDYLVVERSAHEDHAAGLLAFPGGKVEDPPADADPIEATARRELREEVGVEVGDVDVVCSNAFQTDDGTPVLNVVTRCPHESGEPRARDPEEVAAVHWLTYDDLRARDDVPEFLLSYAEQVEADRGDH